MADFSATDALIIKKRLRTEQYDLKHLNEPHFVSSLEDDKHVYFFFRESAVEFMNCGKVRLFLLTSILKFMFSKKATKIEEIFTVDLTVCMKCQIDGEDFVTFCGLLSS